MADKLKGFINFVNENYDVEINEAEKWMQKAFSKNKGKLHKKLGVKADKNISMATLNKKINALKKKKDKTDAELTLQRELVAARTAKRIANKK